MRQFAQLSSDDIQRHIAREEFAIATIEPSRPFMSDYERKKLADRKRALADARRALRAAIEQKPLF